MKKTNTELDNARWQRATRMVLKRYIAEVKHNRKNAIPGLLFPALNNILIAYIPPLAIAGIIQNATQGKTEQSDILPYVLLFAGAWILGEIVMRLAIEFMSRVNLNAMRRLYDDGITSLLERDIAFFHDNYAGSLTKKTLGYAMRFVDTFNTLSFSVTNKLIPIIFASIVLGFYSPWITVCLLSWLIIGGCVAFPLIRKRAKLVTKREIASNVVSGHIADVYGNVDAVRAHASEQEEQVRNRTLVKDLVLKYKHSWDFQNRVVDLAIAPIYVITNVSGLVLALHLAQNGTIEYSALIVIFSYYMLVTNFLWEFNSIYQRLESAISDAAQFTELLITEPTILDPENPKTVDHPRGAVQFHNVQFQYDQGTAPLFTDFSLNITAGEKIGLVGRSGGGKTSITKLLLRFVDINGGSITIDGIKTNEMTQHHLRSLISYVPQEPVMFHRSIRENIAYGNNNATDEEVVAAAKKAHAHEFIKDLPHGYDTLVGERGVKLSGGQRQRVAIARAIVRDAPILLLDEATSALDSESEKLIQDALKKLMKGKTTIVIAHRLSTIQKLDRIIVLDKGEIIEQGTHAELTKQGGVYAELWSHQTGGFIEE